MKKIKVKIVKKIEKLNPEFAKELKWYNICQTGEKLAQDIKYTSKGARFKWEYEIETKIRLNSI